MSKTHMSDVWMCWIHTPFTCAAFNMGCSCGLRVLLSSLSCSQVVRLPISYKTPSQTKIEETVILSYSSNTNVLIHASDYE